MPKRSKPKAARKRAKPPRKAAANQQPDERRVSLFRNGRNQAVRIPREFELEGSEAIMRRDGDRLIIEPAPKPNLLDLLATWEPLDIDFPDVDAGLPPLDEPDLTT